MDGGIGQCKNQACGQTDALTYDGFCSDTCRMEATGCSVPDCGCRGADDGVSRTTTPPLQRVTCPCSWSGIRRNPTGRDCPACGGPREKIQTLWQVGHGPHQSIIYVLHFHWPYGRLDPWRIRLADGSIVKFHADH